MFIKNKKGFSLLEVLVTMGIVAALGLVAVPAYKSYSKNARTTAVKADTSNAQKAYLAHDAVHDGFCYSFTSVGLNNFGKSDLYQKGTRHSFVGFNSTTCPAPAPSPIKELKPASPVGIGGASCTLSPTSFTLGVGYKNGNEEVGFKISSSDAGPTSVGKPNCDGRLNNSNAGGCGHSDVSSYCTWDCCIYLM